MLTRKICFIAGTLSQGGAERQLYYMLRVLREGGNSVDLLCLTQGEYWESRIKALGVSIVFVGRRKARPVRLLRVLEEVWRLKPDVIQSSHFYTNVPAAVAGRVFGIPAIGAIRTDGLREVAGPGKMVGQLNLNLPRLVAANSRAALANARALNVPERRLFFLPNVVDCTEFQPAARSPHAAIRLLIVGRLVDQKRHDRFIRLMGRLRSSLSVDVRGIVAGDGPRFNALQQQISELGLNPADIEFCGVRQDMKTLYNQADILVLTSDWEGTPNAVLEAMASGVAVVSTDVGDVRSLVEDGVSGFVVSKDNEDALAARVQQLIQDPPLRELFAQNARRHIEQHYSLAALSGHLEGLYGMTSSSKMKSLPVTN